MRRMQGAVSLVGGCRMTPRARAVVLAVCSVAIGALFALPAIASAGEACPNEQLRVEQHSTQLPDCRAYEMVSPEYKGGQSALGAGEVVGSGELGSVYAAPDGESVGFSSFGVFANSPAAVEGFNGYIAQRGTGEWAVSPSDVPVTLSPLSAVIEPQDYSSDLGLSVTTVHFAPSGTVTHTSSSEAFYLHAPGGAFIQASPRFRSGGIYDTGSADLSHLVFETSADLSPSECGGCKDTTEEDGSETSHLYEVGGAGGPSPSLSLVGIDDRGEVIDPHCRVELGGEGSKFHAVSQDGSEVFFTTDVEPAEEGGTSKCRENAANPAELFVRVNGSKTLEVSRPLSESCTEVPCPGAKGHAPAGFQGASEDGSKVFFTTTQPLVSADKDSANDLYEAEIGCGPEVIVCESDLKEVTNLVLVSEGDASDPHRGENAEVQGVARISDDGSHVYFVAKGVLTTTPSPDAAGYGAHGEPMSSNAVAQQGADNLYVYDTDTRETKFVAELCSGHEESGSQTGVEECPGSESDGSLWAARDLRPAQSTPNGRFLVFDTYAQLIRTGPEADTDTASDVYRYDSQTGDIVRVSIGENEYDDNGNNNNFNAFIATPEFRTSELKYGDEMSSRAVTEDGSTVVFETAERLSPRAINGQYDIYEWHEGQVGLISGGQSPTADIDPVITPSGRDIFFGTEQGLVAQDVDGLGDIYDARREGGFPQELAAPICSGAGCQGVPPAPPIFATPSSVTFSGVGNFPPPPTPVVKPKAKTLTRAQRLAKALKACRGKPTRNRAACERQAKKHYGAKSKAKKSAKGRSL